MAANRITKKDLDSLCRLLNTRAGTDIFSVEYAYGKPRLYRDHGSREVSPRLPKPELYAWMWAYLDGWDAAVRHGELTP